MMEIQISESWIPTIKKQNKRPVRQRTAEGTTSNLSQSQPTTVIYV